MYNTYPDDFFLLSRQIKLRRIDGYLMQIAVAAAPQSEDREFIDNLLRTQRFMRGEDPNPQIDREGLDALKAQLGMSKTIKVRQAIIKGMDTKENKDLT